MSVPLRPTRKAGGAPAGSASRSPLALALFVALCLGFSALLHAEPLIAAAAAEMHLQPGVVAGVALAVAALFNLAILALNFLVARRPAAGGGGPTTLLHPAATAGKALVPTASASTTTPFAPFMVLCLAMSAALHAEPLVDDAAAAGYQIHPAVVVCVLLSVAALFNWAVISLNFRVARRPAAGEAKLLLHPAGTAGAAPTGSASISPIAPFMGLCLAWARRCTRNRSWPPPSTLTFTRPSSSAPH
ncbi:hypothetical protein HU200_007009 [Digitaria exilis]|uniref:Uncharacterized protein n=1 Tax=Digitaria exilis TaxID=1010633 RepID=A0A835FQE2_9POAL|nr:hypothetical protein HU200_007009 [Digitaria exilis]